jgi:alkylhydroperoxidase family enzyme
VGGAVGISDDQIRNLNWYQESNLFDSDEKLVLELADALTVTPARVSDDLRRRLQKRFSTAQLVELAAAIAWENYRARSNRVFGFGSEGFYKPAAQEAAALKRA